MWQDTRLCKCPRKHSSLGLKWKQTAEKENSVIVYWIRAALKVTAV